MEYRFATYYRRQSPRATAVEVTVTPSETGDPAQHTRCEPGRALPPFYYHQHFLELLQFVREHYMHALYPVHRQFLQDFDELPQSAQCLYVRLVNRKGRVFAARRLRYPELGDLTPALADLQRGGWIEPPGATDLSAALRALTRGELAQLLRARHVGLSRSLKKSEYVEVALANSDHRILKDLPTGSLLAQRRTREVHYLLFLYFGRLPDGLQKFTLRDLGVARVQRFTEDFDARFDTREEAAEQFYFAERLAELQTLGGPDALQRELRLCDDWPEPTGDASTRLRDDLALQLGRAAEAAGQTEDAARVYGCGASADCVERLVRRLLADGELIAARRQLETASARAAHDPRWAFANDLLERKFAGKRTTDATDWLRTAPVVELDESWQGAAEAGVVDWYQRRNVSAARVENGLWRTLFGLLFWEELFSADAQTLHSPFEWRPDSLSDGRFYQRHREQIERKLDLLQDQHALSHELLQTSTRHYGENNGVFRWRRGTLEALFRLTRNADPRCFAPLLRRMSRHFAEYCHGYPDLLVVENGQAGFVEVKAEGDQLRKNQLSRIRELRDAGLSAEIVRVLWTVDPQQEYVVIDVETTGGRGADHRITEFAAVRVVSGKIVDRFQSLINPGRGIPIKITKLTGISEEMVANAPYFDELADRIDAFTDDAIFVAHNVGFDYRFVRHEFARLGKRYRRPRLCTCAQMRKLYPGLPGYSLASLCQQFGIPLRQHHRALCDAEAAAELLMMINDRRNPDAPSRD